MKPNPTPSAISLATSRIRITPFCLIALASAACVSSVLADDGDTISSASFLSPGTRQASLTSGDVDWFRFTTNKIGYFAVYSQGLTDTRAWLYDAAGTYLYISDDNLGEGYNFKIERQLNAGTYFLKVEAGTRGARVGNYSITLRTQESAPWLSGSSHSGHLTAGQIDFVRLGLRRKGLFEIFSTGLTDTKCGMFDEMGTYLYWSDDNLGADYNFHLYKPSYSTGDYLMVIEAGSRGSNTGPYTVHALRPEDAEAVGDGAYSRSLSPRGDIDHFRFTVPSRREVRLWTTGTTDTRAELYDAVGVYQYISDDNSGTGYNFSLRRTLEPGEYFLRVRAGSRGNPSGPYQLHLNLRGGPDAGPVVSNPAAILKQALLRQRAALQKQLKRARSPQAKRKLKKRISILTRRLRAL